MSKIDGKLCVKELAGSMGVSTRYVYEMRACGFAMSGRPGDQRASVEEAVRWIQQNDFRMVNGYGRVGPPKGGTPNAEP